MINGGGRDVEGGDCESASRQFHRIIAHTAADDEGRLSIPRKIMMLQPIGETRMSFHIRPWNTTSISLCLTIQGVEPVCRPIVSDDGLDLSLLVHCLPLDLITEQSVPSNNKHPLNEKKSHLLTQRIRNLGILAHVDAGKTTLTESLLLHSGNIADAGFVDRGTSRSDVLDVERRRGISVRSSSLCFDWQDLRINLIDTPGHVDFGAEVERSLRVLDAAILVVCCVAGVQTQTEVIWRALRQRDLPVLLFVNKIDRLGADPDAVRQQLRKQLSERIVAIDDVVGAGDLAASVVSPDGEIQDALRETIAAEDDALLERYLADEVIDNTQMRQSLARSVGARKLFPVLCGSAKSGAGVEALLHVIDELLPDAPGSVDDPISAVVFRRDRDERLGQVSAVRVFAGRLRTRDRVHNQTADREEQVTQIKRLALDRLEDASELSAGDIGFLVGLPEAQIGDVLGDDGPVPDVVSWSEPLLSVQVSADDPADTTQLLAALQQLSSEDPLLDLQWHAQERELHVRIMGAIQTEILSEILRTRFGLEARIHEPTVIYRETPAAAADGAESYTMPKPCWAIVGLHVEPGAPGSGVEFRSVVGKSDIHPKYQNEIRQMLPTALQQGIKGWQVTDLRITLTEGSHHLLHTRSGDFKLATHMAIMKALQAGDTTLLEPMLAFRVQGPHDLIGRVTSDMIEMRGQIEPAQIEEDSFTLTGRVPLATSMDYVIRLSSISSGRASLSTQYDGFDPVPTELGQVRPYRGISPLDRAKYILWWRGAIIDAIT